MGKKFILIPLLCYAFTVLAQQSRIQYTINDNWNFRNEGLASGQYESFADNSSWEIVNIPHTWNAHDPFDDETGYKRGIGWYRKHLKLSKKELKGKRVFVHFEGANQVTDVYVNHRMVGQHRGGYTAFTFDITGALEDGDQQFIAVSVNNAHNPYIAPLSVGYALYGGIYRDVWLVITDDVHFDLADHGSKGIKVNTPEVSSKMAEVKVNSRVVNDGAKDKNVEVVTQIKDTKGKIIAEKTSGSLLRMKETADFEHSLQLSNPHLWSPGNPYLYTVSTTIKSNGNIVDKVDSPLGIRWFSFDPNEGFSLNGKQIKLKGTNRHQDFSGRGSALTNEDHRRDMEMIKNMGCNFIRIAHYPQDPEILQAADELGLIAWEEVPLVNYMNISKEFYKNSATMLREMIHQHYNHPAVVMWGSMNEIFLYGSNEDRIQLQEDTTYVHHVRNFAQKLDSVIRAEDPYRYSTMAMHMSSDYDRYGIEDIPQVAAFNVYSGWYSGQFDDFGKSFDRRHVRKPGQVIMISEYGAGSDKRLNAKDPERFDFTGQYQQAYHESYLRQIKARKFIAGTAIWNQFDFSQPEIGGSMPHLNQKGVATWDRKPKDVYFLYKANWNPEPMVHLAEKDWPVRASVDAHPAYTITAYGNTKKIDLYLNGRKVGSRKPDDINKASWNVKLEAGKNVLRAEGIASDGKRIEDRAIIEVQKIDQAYFTAIRINAGSNAQYLDLQSNPWIEDSPFNGFYGYNGGEPTFLNRKDPIRGSDDDPMYYSCLEKVKNYKIKIPDGRYQATLYFIEGQKLQPGARVFDVSINDIPVIEDLDLTKEAGFCYGLKKTFQVDVENGELNFQFLADKGETTLSGLEIIKID